MSPDEIVARRDQSTLARLNRDSQILEGLKVSSGLSEEMMVAMSNYIREKKSALEAPPSTPTRSSMPPYYDVTTKTTPHRRTASQRSSGDEEEPESAQKMTCSKEHRFLRPDPKPQRATARNYASVTAASTVVTSLPSTSTHPQATGARAASTSTTSAPSASMPTLTTTPTPAEEEEEQSRGERREEKKTRYPPLVVEQLPEWTTHFKKIRAEIGRPPNARPFGNGVRFTPQDENEYRVIQRYLEALVPKVPWFSYSLPKDKDIKVAIRGLPYDTQPEDIKEDLREKGFDVEYTRRIKASRGRPGCLFFAILRRREDTIPAIYEQKEILCMPGIKIENWRGRKGPAQCHRCQQFRHSSHCCHRKQACVRCGEEHFARECPRPKTEPATCANCKGSHPANSRSCPILIKETKNRRAGTVALTTAHPPSRTAPPPRVDVQEYSSTNLMAPANLPQRRTPTGTREGEPTQKKKKKKKKKKKTNTQAASQSQSRPASASQTYNEARETRAPAPRTISNARAPRIDNERLAVIEAAISTLQDVLNALKSGSDPVPVILQGMSKLITAQYG